MKKHILTMLLAVAMVFSVMAVATSAEGTNVASIGTDEYPTLQAAIDAAEANNVKDIVIDLLADATLDITAWQTLAIGGADTETITINGNGKTLTFNKLNSDWNHVATNNDAKLILNNMTITDSGRNNGPWNRYDINFGCDVELNNVTSTKALAFKADATLNTVAITEVKDAYAIWVQANGQDIAINGLTVTSAGRGIKIDDQYVDAPTEVELSVENATFTTAKKAAIMVKTAAGVTIDVGANVDITNVAADSTNIVWNDSDAAADYGKIEVTGGSVAQEDSTDFAATISRDGKVVGYYGTLQAAINAAVTGDTVTLLAECAENVTVTQAPGYTLTIDGNNNTFTGSIVIDGKSGTYLTSGVTIKNLNFDGTGITADACINLGNGTNATRYTCNVTVDSCTFTGIGETKVAIKSYTGGDKNLTITGCDVSSGMHSLLQVKNVTGVTISGCTVDAKNGVSIGASENVAISGCTIIATGYGIRANGDGGDINNVVVENCTITADQPIVVRKVKNDYTLTLSGTNNLTATNENGYTVTFTTGDDGTYEAPIGVEVTVAGGEDENIFPVYIAEVNGVKYDSLEAANNAAKATGDVIVLLSDIELSADVELTQTVEIHNALTINGNGCTITTSAEKGFRIFNDGTDVMPVTFTNVKIVDTANFGRCIDTRTDNINLTLDNCELTALGVSSQPLTIGGTEMEGLTVNVNGGKISSGKSGYAIISFVPVELNISGNVSSGYGCIYMKDGSAGSVINLNAGVEIASVNENIYALNDTNSFSAIMFEDDNITFNVNDGAKLSATAGESAQSIFSYRATPVTLNVAANTEFEIIGDKARYFTGLCTGLVMNIENADLLAALEEVLPRYGLALYNNVTDYAPVLDGEFAGMDSINVCGDEYTVEFTDYVIANATVTVNGTKVDVTSGSYTVTPGEYTVVVTDTDGAEMGRFTVSLQDNHSMRQEYGSIQHWKKCAHCGYTDSVGYHAWTFGATIEEATETTEGKDYYICYGCGGTEYRTTPVLGHTHASGEEWKSDEIRHWTECSCGEVMDLEGHVWNEGVQTEDEIVYTCTVCGAEKTGELPAHVHVAGSEFKYNDETHWNECECGEKLNEGNHLWVTDKVENGTIYSKCVLCEATAETPEQTDSYDDESVNYLLSALAISVITVAFAAVMAKRKFN